MIKSNMRTISGRIVRTYECKVCGSEWEDLSVLKCEKCLSNPVKKNKLKPLDEAFKKLDKLLSKQKDGS